MTQKRESSLCIGLPLVTEGYRVLFICKTRLFDCGCKTFSEVQRNAFYAIGPNMRPEKPKRVEVNPIQNGLAGLGDALAGLNLGPLPAGPPAAQPTRVERPRQRSRGRVVLRKEKAHRGGKTVIVAHDFPLTVTPSELEGLAKQLRQALGTGGTVRERTIEIQGDQPAKVRAVLEGEGFIVTGI
jgi:translation initiation factor 1